MQRTISYLLFLLLITISDSGLNPIHTKLITKLLNLIVCHRRRIFNDIDVEYRNNSM